MVVTLLCRGLRITGLHIGIQNAKRFFPPGSTTVELQLDHVRILCGLDPRFWEDRPELSDPRLCLWLESKFHLRPCSSSPVPLALIPAGKNTFRLTALAIQPAQALEQTTTAALTA